MTKAPKGLGWMPRRLCWMTCTGLVQRTALDNADSFRDWDGTEDCVVF